MFINISSKAKFSVVTVSDNDGVVTIETETILGYFNLNDRYEVKILKIDSPNEKAYDIGLGEDIYPCFTLSFFRSGEEPTQAIIEVQ